MMEDMDEYEQSLRERFDVDDLLTLRIKDLDQGKELVEKIDRWLGESLNEMRESNLNNDQSDIWFDVLYDLKTARKKIQSQMALLVRRQMKSLLPKRT
jgi:hypothetical protein